MTSNELHVLEGRQVSVALRMVQGSTTASWCPLPGPELRRCGSSLTATISSSP